jgi:hypothetical protein
VLVTVVVVDMSLKHFSWEGMTSANNAIPII